ncbi:myoneurin isoform X2 [Denticeps clupeoides]|uniref:Myoneurin n=1 Tax=Denticeps clupeoides TaxID=299321 RepID=A0AAY4F165_9TELE|nr:myoneurin isoform X2 [Denticeps clupeoides]
MSSVAHAELLLERLRTQRGRGRFCDCAVAVGRARFSAHRNVLAAFSDYFASWGAGGHAGDVATLDPECVDEAALRTILDYIYTGELRLDSDCVSSIRKAASFLGMAEVLSQCDSLGQAAIKAPSGDTIREKTAEADAQPHSPGSECCDAVVPAEEEQKDRQNEESEHLEDQEPLENTNPSSPHIEQVSHMPQKRGRKPNPKHEVKEFQKPESSRGRGRGRPRGRGRGRPTGQGRGRPKAMVSEALETPDPASNTEDDNQKLPTKRRKSSRKRIPSKKLKENCFSDIEEPEEADGAAGDTDREGKETPPLRDQLQSKEKPVCSTCGKIFSELSSLRRHMRIHNGLKPYKCQLCGRTFRQGNQLKTHIRIHTGEKPFKCDRCDKSYAQKCQLVFHCRMHHGEEKPFKCDDCGLQFATSSNLKIHCRKHNGEKPYYCELCEKRFAQASTLTYHMRRHTGEKPYVCDTCGKAFAVSSSLITHSKKHTGEKAKKPVEKVEAPYLCLVCGKRFFTTGELRKHMDYHSGSKRMICDICGQTLSDANYLRRHKEKKHNAAAAAAAATTGAAVEETQGSEALPLNIPIDHQSLIARVCIPSDNPSETPEVQNVTFEQLEIPAHAGLETAQIVIVHTIE